MIKVINFYKFIYLENYIDMQEPLLDFCLSINLKGTILLAEEGVNCAVAGEKEQLEEFCNFVTQDLRLQDLDIKAMQSNFIPFKKMKVRLKHSIVALMKDEMPQSHNANDAVDPEDWNEIINDDEIPVIDIRNDYEVKLGRFQNSINPATNNFRDFTEWVANWAAKCKNKKKVAMYCTGGVRCEKSAVHMKELGFERIYQLKGGIINYLQETRNSDGYWVGECFVFDNRIAIDDECKPSSNLYCLKCNTKVYTQSLTDISHGNILCRSCIRANVTQLEHKPNA